LKMGFTARVMNRLIAFFVFSVCLASCSAAGADEAAITGRVIVTKVLTKKRVALPAYDLRGRTASPPSPTKAEKEEQPGVDELSRVVIYLEGPGLNPGSPAKATLRQRSRRFDPELVVIPVGSTVGFPNEDPIFHNVFSLSKAKQFDLGYYPAGESRAVKFDRPGVVQVFCHLHADMSATILVLDTAFWTRPAPDGSFSLPGVPAGSYELVAWHRSAGPFRRPVTLIGGQSLAVDFVIPVKEQGAGKAPQGR